MVFPVVMYESESWTIKKAERIVRPGSMHDTGCLGLMNWDDSEVWYREGGGRGVQDGEQCQTLFLRAPKSLQMVIAAMKLKDTYSLEGKL